MSEPAEKTDIMEADTGTDSVAEPEGSEMSDDVCQIVRSNKGGPKLIHRGYIYTVHKQRPGMVRWRCTRRSLNCRGSMTTTAISPKTKSKILMAHNHVPDRNAVARTLSWGQKTAPAADNSTSPSSPEFTSALEQNEGHFNRLKNLGTAVKPTTQQSLLKKKKSPEKNIIDQHDGDLEWKPPYGKIKIVSDVDTKTTLETKSQPPMPIKVSKRIMEKKRMKKPIPPPQIETEDDNYAQMRSNHINKIKITNITSNPIITPTEPVTESKKSHIPLNIKPAMALAEDEEVCLRWNSHHNNMQTAFPFLLAREQYVDVTLSSEGQSIRCHKLVLSACSSYFDEVISGLSPWQHPVIYLKGIPFWVLKALIDFMYVGEVGIEQSKLQTILNAGQELKIKGLTTLVTPQQLPAFTPAQLPPASLTPAPAPASTPQMGAKNAASLLQVKTDNVFLYQMKSSGKSTPVKVKEEFKDEKMEEKPIKPVNKRPAKRPLSENETISPLPEHLLFMRKGTRSRPLVKTPKIYQDDHFSSSFSKSDSSFATLTPQKKSTPLPQQQRSLLKFPSGSTEFPILAIPDDKDQDILSAAEIKQEPIDIGETDVTFNDYQSGENCLLFDEPDNDDDDDDDEFMVDDNYNPEEDYFEVITQSFDEGQDGAARKDAGGGLTEQSVDESAVGDKAGDDVCKDTLKDD